MYAIRSYYAIIAIPEFVFPGVFILFNSLLILGCRKFVKIDATSNLALIEPTKLSPLDIAVLKNGLKGAISYGIYNLWGKGLVNIEGYGSTLKISRNAKGSAVLLDDLDNSLFSMLDQALVYHDFFEGEKKKTIQTKIQSNLERLNRFRLTATKKDKQRYWNVFFLGTFSLFVVALSILSLGLENSMYVLLLMVLLILSIGILYWMIKPTQVIYTDLGKRVIATAEQRFLHLKLASSSNRKYDKKFLYGAAIFGIFSFLPYELMAGVITSYSIHYTKLYDNTGRIS